MEASDGKEETPLPSALSRFQLSEDYGFLLPNPLTELPDPYGPWMEIARELPQLIASHRLRSRVHQMPQLSTRHLRGREELYLAHLVLSFITMGYLWQEGEEGTVKVLPRHLAVPFWEVSQALGLPPILSHADFVLANWRRKDPSGPLEIENLDTIISLPGGESLRGFILVTFLVEKAAVPGIKAILQAIRAIRQLDEETLHQALQGLATAIGAMGKALQRMHDYVDPAVFYAVIRIFLSGLTCLQNVGASLCGRPLPEHLVSWLSWKDNPAMPEGLVYEGVSEEPMAFSGGSAAQSTILHAFDELLGIHHSQESTAFLHRMRDYMPPPHRAFIEEIRRAPSLKQHVLCSGDTRLRAAFNRCITALADFRSYHITIVTKYIAVAKAKAGWAEVGGWAGRPPAALEAKGTGGSHIFSFLKSVRDTTRDGLISA
ncbi:indoleamine 2,3-dioxygenase 2 isoform X1 [Oxyura jamaicensis]|uniref:indoleamine 2,3-dioxygenase 2 isoform X1 n=1 Tax=Oxyura jamaicensis TaxID=8884 RepID=UPI0015A6B343|nr:indoleamine 2,3-dioxygenase 2 isoform X1 [Oxyura jamaicensis]